MKLCKKWRGREVSTSFSQAKDIRLLVLGATGLVGSHVLSQALANSSFSTIIAPTRTPIPSLDTSLEKLINPQIDYENISAYEPEWEVDAVICALGTTIKKAGNRDTLRRIDYDYPLEFSRLAQSRGASSFALTSAIGANPDSYFFYNRVKGELEQALERENFSSLTFVRPSVIAGNRQESRPGEIALKFALTVLSPLLPRRWHLNPASEIAARLIQSVIFPQPRTTIIQSMEMTGK
ncbi:NAD-dependent dehydratase [Pseudoalteromonas sp. SSMSWG5]|uniref:NAD-dependent dehydratase n=1 Tax=Pseudoalteromonas sp. SSMSWG5 TaxID=3139396 RepID=UPI003BA99AB6